MSYSLKVAEIWTSHRSKNVTFYQIKKTTTVFPDLATVTSNQSSCSVFLFKRALVNAELIIQSLSIFSFHALVIIIDLNLRLYTNLTCILDFYHGSYFVQTQQSDKCETTKQQKLHLLIAST